MLRSVNPATGETVAEYPEMAAADIEDRLNAATATYKQWSRTSIDERTHLLDKLADLYLAKKDKLARMVTSEMGKTLASSTAEVEKCAKAFRYYAQNGASMLETMRINLIYGGHAELHWMSLGPILAVMPWNFPVWQVVRFLAPAILAGNAGLLKHASIVQGTAMMMQEIMREAGAPEGLFQNLAIKSDAVAPIIADPRVVAVTLTGSEGAGSAVAAEAGKRLKKTVLELGGSDPFIVMPSADLNEAVKQAVLARIQNTGQSCICGKRMIVHTVIYDSFMEKFSTAMNAVKTGDPLDPATDMGPLSSHAQRDRVMGQMQQAQKLGGRLSGGAAMPGPGAFVSAGILTDIPLGSPMMREEIFGPIAMVFRARDINDAISIANNIPFGLGSSVWTKDEAEQKRFIRDIEAGMVAVNRMLASSPDAPFGGVKQSGYGRELGPFGLHEFMNLKSVFYAA